jgi:hypothetical protein
MKCSYNYPWGKYFFGFKKNSDPLFEMNILNLEMSGVDFFKKFMCFDIYTKLVQNLTCFRSQS